MTRRTNQPAARIRTGKAFRCLALYLCASLFITACSDTSMPHDRATANAGPEDAQALVHRAGLERQWRSVNIGQSARPEEAPDPGTEFPLAGNGSGIDEQVESIRFVFRPLLDNGFLAAKVDCDPEAPPRNAGVMLREGLEPGQRFALLSVESDGTIAFWRRTTRGAAPLVTRTPRAEGAVWVQLVREGEAIVASYSMDGTEWRELSADTVRMPSLVHAGVAVAGGPDGPSGEVQFSDIALLDVKLAHPGVVSPIVLPAGVPLKVEMSAFDVEIRHVEFVSGAARIGEAQTAPFQFVWTNALAGKHALLARVTDQAGRTVFSEPVQVVFEMPPARADFLGVDDLTRGAWKGTYGAKGFVIANAATNLPAWTTLIPAGQESFLWGGNRPDERVLQHPEGAPPVAGCWFSPGTFIIDIDLLDGTSRRLAAYCLDWENQRGQKVEVFDSKSGVMLDSRTLHAFREGVYLQWEIQGAIQLRITPLPGSPNAVVSGLFFD